MKRCLLVFVCLPVLLFAQSRKDKKALALRQKENQQIATAIAAHQSSIRQIVSTYPAHALDSIAAYIALQLKTAGLQPSHSDSFIQHYTVDEGKQIGAETFLKINGQLLQPQVDYFPLPFSACKPCQGMPAIALREKNQPWFADMKDLMGDGSGDTALYSLIRREAVRAASKGATALLVHGSATPAFHPYDTMAAVAIPVLYIQPAAAATYLKDKADLVELDMNVALPQKTYAGCFVSGKMDKAAANNAVIHAPLPTDTASLVATALALEVAKRLSGSAVPRQNNYVFVMGALPDGRHLTDVVNSVNYIIELLPGSAATSVGEMFVAHGSTSPQWSMILGTLKDTSLAHLQVDSTHVHFTEKNITAPTLRLGVVASAAMHSEPWEVRAVRLLQELTDGAEQMGKLTFTPVKMPDSIGVADKLSPAAGTNKVSLGIVADEKYSGEGVRIKQLSPKRAGAAIGLQTGDVLLSLGHFNISDFKSYMHALAQYKSGDTTTLKIKRNNEAKEFKLVF